MLLTAVRLGRLATTLAASGGRLDPPRMQPRRSVSMLAMSPTEARSISSRAAAAAADDDEPLEDPRNAWNPSYFKWIAFGFLLWPAIGLAGYNLAEWQTNRARNVARRLLEAIFDAIEQPDAVRIQQLRHIYDHELSSHFRANTSFHDFLAFINATPFLSTDKIASIEYTGYDIVFPGALDKLSFVIETESGQSFDVEVLYTEEEHDQVKRLHGISWKDADD